MAALPSLTNLLAVTPQPVPSELSAALAPADQPLALLPVRLETRFFVLPGGAHELRIRVFPDQIHVDAHEPGLTAGEIEWGKHFWEQMRAAADEAARRAAWHQLADRFDATRAAWIARVLTPLDGGGPQPPRFPEVTPRPAALSEGWASTPEARAMPSRWFALARMRGQVIGHAISLPSARAPALGPAVTDVTGTATPTDDAELAIDPGMRWMVDFAVAEAEGMALRLMLPAGTAPEIDTLIVFGVDIEASDAQGAASIAELLDAHHYSDGLGFITPGTPTNNTTDEESGHGSADPGHARSFDSHWRDALTSSPPDASRAERTGRALGIDPAACLATLGAIEGAGAREALAARQMATALWPATWGYYLGNLLGPEGMPLTPPAVDWARAHFIDHVRALGPLPALRVGRQPYGLLPVTLLGDWTPGADAGEGGAHALELRNLLLMLRDRLWRPRLDGVPRLGRFGSSSTDAEVAAVMQTDALASGYRLRQLLGPRLLQHLRLFLGIDAAGTGWIANMAMLTHAVLNQLGLNWRPRLGVSAYAPQTVAIDGPLVRDGDAEAIRSLLAAPPLQAPASATPPDGAPVPGEPASLLVVLLRHALQLEYMAVAARLAAATPGSPPVTTLLRDVELMNFNPATQVVPWHERLAQKTPASGELGAAEFLRSAAGLAHPAAAPLRACRDALEHLATLDPAALQYQLAGTLDLCSHRLDAWITSFATERLDAMRRRRPTGLRVGAYGWVLNLRPAPAGAPLPTPTGESGPVFALAGDPGFLHAPSLEHAQTAALLRKGHLGKANLQAEGAFAIDLSSRRVRIAEQLLDGVRQGQPLAALLGYRFERRLHELKLDTYIERCRKLAPLVSEDAPPPSAASEAITAQRVVDGLKLHAQWQAFVKHLPSTLPNPDSPFMVCGQALRELDDAIDALADAVVAETIYQTVRGNTVRTASTLSAIAHGEAPPPELDVARTPRSGIGLTHRVLWLLPGTGAVDVPQGWVQAAASPRAAAEPRLNAWAGRLLPAPARVRLTVEQVGDDGAVTARTELRVSDLRLSPLDFVYMAPTPPGAPTPELDARVLHLARSKDAALARAPQLRVDSRRHPDFAADEFSLREALEVAARARACLGGARAADPRDLAALDAASNGEVAAADLEDHAAAAGRALGAVADALDALVAQADRADPAALGMGLLALQGFGLSGAVPVAPSADATADRAALLVQARALVVQARERIAAPNPAPDPDADGLQRATAATVRLRALFGNDFLALAPFTVSNAAALSASLGASTALQGGDALAIWPWCQRMARVREPVARLSTLLHAAEGTQAAEQPLLKVAQLPHVAGERWVGLPLPAGAELPAGKLSLVVQAPPELDAAQALVGLWIDDWVEVVPAARENTAIAFQFNAPDASAPQAVLLAVPPDETKAWTPWMLHRLLLETLELAMVRAVDAEALDTAALNPIANASGVGEVGHFLPALCFAVNAQGDALAPDFSTLT